MRKMKRLLSILMAATMTLAMAAPAFADDGATIKVTNASNDITYEAYKIFAGTRIADGTQLSYTATKEQKDWFEKQDGNPFAFKSNSGDDASTYYVEIAEGKDGNAVETFLAGLVKRENDTNVVTTDGFADPSPITGTKSGDDGTEINFTGLDFGYYMITSSMNSVVSLTPTTPNVTVIDKNQKGPSITPDDPDDPKTEDGKKVKRPDETDWGNVTSANYEGQVDFKVQYTVTNYYGSEKITSYTVSDTLGDGLSYVVDNENKVVAKAYSATFTKDDEGKETIADKTEITGCTIVMGNDGNSFKITIPWEDKVKSSPAKLIVEYSATVVDNGEVNDNSDSDNGRENTANISFTKEGDTDPTDPDDPKTTETTATTKTYAIAINKTDPKGVALQGAEFVLKSGDAAIPVREAVDPETKEVIVGVYEYDPDGTAVLTSPEGGIITIKGVQAGSYTVTETKAPNGYNLLPTAQTVETTLETEYTTTHTVYYDENGNVTDEKVFDSTKTVDSPVAAPMTHIINESGTTLPSTGGIGTTVFYAAGILLMAGAVFFIVRRKRA